MTLATEKQINFINTLIGKHANYTGSFMSQQSAFDKALHQRHMSEQTRFKKFFQIASIDFVKLSSAIASKIISALKDNNTPEMALNWIYENSLETVFGAEALAYAERGFEESADTGTHGVEIFTVEECVAEIAAHEKSIEEKQVSRFFGLLSTESRETVLQGHQSAIIEWQRRAGIAAAEGVYNSPVTIAAMVIAAQSGYELHNVCISVDEAAKTKNVAKNTLYRLLRNEDRRAKCFPNAIRQGTKERGEWLLSISEVEAWQPASTISKIR